MDGQKLNYLILKYVDGSATSAERDELLRWYNVTDEQDLPLPYQDDKEETEAKERIQGLLLASIRNQRYAISSVKTPLWYAVAASILLFTVIGLVFIWHAQKPAPILTANNIIKTTRGQRKKMILTDGSVIWLNPGSTLSYPSVFTGATREIIFEGEAFFDIAHDKTHPFIVHSGKTAIKVLGTTFNINAYPNQQNMSVSLITGKVDFYNGALHHVLSPGKRIVYAIGTKNIKVESIEDAEIVTARRDGIYEYKNTRVEDIAEDINRNFNIKVNVEGDVKNCLFYGRLKPGENPDQFLRKLGKVVNAEVIKQENTYTIKGGGCIK
jgi:ferric-dicitrate binding protein FerR (iron transport regulator)